MKKKGHVGPTCKYIYIYIYIVVRNSETDITKFEKREFF